jgi:hypothetical protein
MTQAFIVVQIGNEQLDQLCADAIVPALVACGLAPKRVDKHNEGGLLKSEIVRFIEESDIIVADLTNERPNVYLEIGYAMGMDKFRNLVLTVREDHFPDSPNHQPNGPRVHFDLAGYDILRWHPQDVDRFRSELEKRIRRRLAIIAPPATTTPAVWDLDWIEAQRRIANAGLVDIGQSGFMEVRAALHAPKISTTPSALNDAAKNSQIRTFGWPIAVHMDVEGYRPRPRVDGIAAEIKPDSRESYDYWAIRRNGDFYFVGSLFEDKRRPGELFFNTRIVRVTEALLYLARLYPQLGVDRSQLLTVAVRHGGLDGRVLTASSSNRSLHRILTSAESEIDIEITATLDEIEAELVQKVKELVAPLFQLFDFFELNDSVYEDIVNRFVKGEVT